MPVSNACELSSEAVAVCGMLSALNQTTESPGLMVTGLPSLYLKSLIVILTTCGQRRDTSANRRSALELGTARKLTSKHETINAVTSFITFPPTQHLSGLCTVFAKI
jgi:hypothetical protein